MISPLAVVSPGAKLGADVEVGPFAVIDENVTLGDGCKVGPSAYLTGYTTIGAGTEIHKGAVLGDTPQDLHFGGEVSYLEIGEKCIIREYVTVHRSAEAGGKTRIGNNVMLMAFSHLGHDCEIADNVVVANATLLAGHVTVGDHAFISGSVMVHQFVRIGRLAMVGGGNAIGQDVPPFCLLQEDEIYGTNVVGLRRAGMKEENRNALREAVKIYFGFGLTRNDAVARISSEIPSLPEVKEFIDFVMSTKRGICSGHKLN